ncbi:MAG: glycosyltransferase [Selenomonadaceae bacterium]|nr:glycosyltransferase [Selenomonadaceae bacterium]
MTFEGFIPPRSKNVLEVIGDAPEDFETSRDKFLEIQPDCSYAVEKYLSNGKGKFDTILIHSAIIGNLGADSLVSLIKNAAKKLQPRGTLVFALDNVGFIDNVMAILEGRPLKFKITLTKVELEDAIDTAGLNRIRSLNAARRMEIAQGIADNAKIDVATFTYIISATPDELPPKTMIQSLIGEKLVCAPVRIHIPNTFLLTEPNLSTVTVNPERSYRFFTEEQFQNRIFINQRRTFGSFKRGADFFGRMQRIGYLYITEMDDHPVLWKKSYEETGWINFIGAHALQTSTEYLADFLRQYNPNVRVFANQLRRILPLREFNSDADKPVTIFFGALNRDRDFEEILPVINQFAEEYGDRLAFKIIARTKLFNSIQSENKTLVGNPRYYDGQFVPANKYEETLRECDIALLPLIDNQFNRGKSDLKFIECAGNGTAVLASPVAYEKTVRDGETGFIFRDTKEFADKLRILIDNADKRREIATAAYEYVKHNRLLSQHYEERLDWYLELIARLPELNEETQARIDKAAPEFENEEPKEVENASQSVEGISAQNAEIIIPSSW